LKGINVILGLFAKDDHSKINMAIDASQCVVIMERIAQAIGREALFPFFIIYNFVSN
jgi:hypothetical protein